MPGTVRYSVPSLRLELSSKAPAADRQRHRTVRRSSAYYPAPRRLRCARISGNARSRLMPRFSTVHQVRHSAADMYDPLDNVERSPSSVPLCRSLKIRKRIPEPEGVEILAADMTVAYKFVHETFASRVTLDRPNLQILVEYPEGPFSRLEN